VLSVLSVRAPGFMAEMVPALKQKGQECWGTSCSQLAVFTHHLSNRWNTRSALLAVSAVLPLHAVQHSSLRLCISLRPLVASGLILAVPQHACTHWQCRAACACNTGCTSLPSACRHKARVSAVRLSYSTKLARKCESKPGGIASIAVGGAVWGPRRGGAAGQEALSY
jgi:hypothetical protein